MNNGQDDEQPQLRDGRGFWFIMLEIELVRQGYWARISLAAKAVYVVLVSHAGRDWRAWPGIPKIAAEAGLSQRAVITAIQDLERHALIRVERDPAARHAAKRAGTNRYTIAPLGKHRDEENDSVYDSANTSHENTSHETTAPDLVQNLHPKQIHRSKDFSPPLGATAEFPIPADFTVTAAMKAKVAPCGYSDAILAKITRKFIADCESKGLRSFNWAAKWVKFVEMEGDWGAPKTHARGRRDEPYEEMDHDQYKDGNYLKVRGGRS